jgi:hypothetical protein
VKNIAAVSGLKLSADGDDVVSHAGFSIDDAWGLGESLDRRGAEPIADDLSQARRRRREPAHDLLSRPDRGGTEHTGHFAGSGLRQHLDDVVMPVLPKWRIFERDDFGAEGARRRDELAAFFKQMALLTFMWIGERVVWAGDGEWGAHGR